MPTLSGLPIGNEVLDGCEACVCFINLIRVCCSLINHRCPGFANAYVVGLREKAKQYCEEFAAMRGGTARAPTYTTQGSPAKNQSASAHLSSHNQLMKTSPHTQGRQSSGSASETLGGQTYSLGGESYHADHGGSAQKHYSIGLHRIFEGEFDLEHLVQLEKQGIK